MSVIASKAISAGNQWSDVFELQGDSGHMPCRSAMVNATRDDSTVTLRRYAAATDAVDAYLSSLDLGGVMQDIRVSVTGYYRVGVATGNYGGTALTITVEQ